MLAGETLLTDTLVIHTLFDKAFLLYEEAYDKQGVASGQYHR